MNMRFMQVSNKYLEHNWNDKKFIKEFDFCLGVNNADL